MQGLTETKRLGTPSREAFAHKFNPSKNLKKSLLFKNALLQQQKLPKFELVHV